MIFGGFVWNLPVRATSNTEEGGRMLRITRRTFVFGSVGLPMGCMSRSRAADPISVTHLSPVVRPPELGQSWRYARNEGITGKLIDIQVDRVSAIDQSVNIESWSEGAPPDTGPSSWGAKWLRPFERAASRPSGLPSEVQAPWGMIIVDPHWDLVQVYKRPIPLWPTQLRPGWRSLINTQYRTTNATDLPWQQTMRAYGWDSISVPAGQFMALRYTNWINFTHSDFSWTNAVRQETLWLAPEVGRWVARESRGSYYHADSVADQPFIESSYRWELLDWS
jgi:hypothetical protein